MYFHGYFYFNSDVGVADTPDNQSYAKSSDESDFGELTDGPFSKVTSHAKRSTSTPNAKEARKPVAKELRGKTLQKDAKTQNDEGTEKDTVIAFKHKRSSVRQSCIQKYQVIFLFSFSYDIL